MSRHPVTPMDEADLLLHLQRQTDLSSGLVDLVDLQSGHGTSRLSQLAADKTAIVLLDVISHETQALVGETLWGVQARIGPFVAGSSGVEYALLSAWRKAGLIGSAKPFSAPGPVERLAVVSGSVSPTTERQIRHALARGFAGMALDPLSLLGESSEQAIAEAVEGGLAFLRLGRSVILYTALGPAADRGDEIDRNTGARHSLGRALGRILARLVLEERLARAVIAGGDTSSHALGELGVEALTVRMPLPESPGSPLCTAHGAASGMEGLQIALKGGQVGTDRYFEAIRAGASLPE